MTGEPIPQRRGVIRRRGPQRTFAHTPRLDRGLIATRGTDYPLREVFVTGSGGRCGAPQRPTGGRP